MSTILSLIGRWWTFVDERGIVRRAVLGVAIWMTWRVSVWAMGYAADSPRPGVDVAAIIAAVSAPVTLFAGAVFKAYSESRAS